MHSSLPPPPPDSDPDTAAEPPPTPAEIARAHNDFLRAVGERLGLSGADAEEVVQSIAEDLVRHPDRIPGRRKLRAWLRAIVVNKVRGLLQRSARRLPHELPFTVEQEPPLARAPSTEDLLVVQQTRAVVREAIGRLPEERREVLVRHAILGEPLPAIAVALGIPYGTCCTRLRLARGELLASLSRAAAEDERRSGERRFGVVPLVGWWCVGEEWAAPSPLAASPPAASPPAASPSGDERGARGWAGIGARVRRPVGLFVAAVMLLVCSAAHPPGVGAAIGLGAGEAAGAAAGEVAAGGEAEPARGPVAAAGEAAEEAEGEQGQGRGREVEPASSAPRTEPRIETRTETLTSIRRGPAPRAPGTSRPGGSAVASSGPPPPRDLALARAWMKRAEQSAADGDDGAAREALRGYDTHAPDDPLPATRRGVVEAIERGAQR